MSGPDGLVRLLAEVETGELPMADAHRVVMRLLVPCYEQARPYFDRAVAEGVVETSLPPGYFYVRNLRVILDAVPVL